MEIFSILEMNLLWLKLLMGVLWRWEIEIYYDIMFYFKFGLKLCLFKNINWLVDDIFSDNIDSCLINLKICFNGMFGC